MSKEKRKEPGERFHRRIFFGPILLITIGLVFLAKNMGMIPGEGWDTIWRLWPLLLIVGGLDDLFRREGVAWPVLMIGLGSFLLYHYFGPRSLISWTQILQLWPILIIAVGIDVLFKGQSGWISLVGILLSVVLIGAAVLLAVQGVQVPADYLKIDEDIPAGVESAEIELSLAAGELVLTDTPTEGKFITGSITPGDAEDELEEEGGQFFFALASTQLAFLPHTARWELDITPVMALDLKVDNSIGEMMLDVDALDLAGLFANQGVGRMLVDLPPASSGEILIKQGVGLIEVQIPEDTRIAVDAQNGLTRVRFPGDFELEDGFYMNPGTSETNAQLMIVVEQGVGLVNFQYEK